MSSPKAFEIIVKGRVQGVGYRYFVLQKALNLNLHGYVRNLANGDVEIFCQGEESAVQNFILQCKEGPVLAMVKVFNVIDVPLLSLNGFSIR